MQDSECPAFFDCNTRPDRRNRAQQNKSRPYSRDIEKSINNPPNNYEVPIIQMSKVGLNFPFNRFGFVYFS